MLSPLVKLSGCSLGQYWLATCLNGLPYLSRIENSSATTLMRVVEDHLPNVYGVDLNFWTNLSE